MRIDILVDVYPHPSKPYFDVQFMEWRRAGHEINVFSLSRIVGAVAPVEVKTLKTLRSNPIGIAIAMLWSLLSRTKRSLAVLKSAPDLSHGVKQLAVDAQMPKSVPDLFFIHNLAAANRWRYLKQALPSVPCVLYYHGGEIAGVPSVLASDASRALRDLDVVFSNTKFSAADVVSRGAASNRVRIIPVGFKLTDFPDDSSRLYRKDGKFHLVSVGRLAVEKGFDIAMHAIAELRGFRNDFVYTIIGDGPERKALEALSRTLGINEFTTFAGSFPSDRVIAALSGADALLLSSIPANTWQENQACVMQEAMLMRVPVIASNTGGVKESIPTEMHQYLFEPGSPRALALNLANLLNQGEQHLRDLGTVGRSFVVGRYDVELINKQLLDESVTRC